MNIRAHWVSLASTVATVALMISASSGQEPAAKAKKVVKTDAEWRKQLTPNQYAVTRMAATEPAGTGALLHNKAKGVYQCVGCGSPLFSSRTKFESGTGWPSFYAPYNQANITTATDYKMNYARTEVICSTCDAHLGHVFDDGPAPTGLRFCMNSAALKFAKDTPPAKATKEDATKTDKSEKAEKSDAATALPK